MKSTIENYSNIMYKFFKDIFCSKYKNTIIFSIIAIVSMLFMSLLYSHANMFFKVLILLTYVDILTTPIRLHFLYEPYVIYRNSPILWVINIPGYMYVFSKNDKPMINPLIGKNKYINGYYQRNECGFLFYYILRLYEFVIFGFIRLYHILFKTNRKIKYPFSVDKALYSSSTPRQHYRWVLFIN